MIAPPLRPADSRPRAHEGTGIRSQFNKVPNFMTRFAALLLGVVFLAGAAFAQDTQPSQSLRPTPSACTAGSQSVRVCSNGFRSCNDVCAARALSANSDVAGCATSCCNQFNVCLQMRNCGGARINCN